MLILGIETSCDETAAAVVEKTKDGRLRLVSNVVASSEDLHKKTGGVVPENAAREQVKSIIPVLNESLVIDHCSLDAISVTTGPGLIGSLLIGVEAARVLSYVWRKNLISVGHVSSHIFSNWLQAQTPKMPTVSLVVSGGHTELFYMKSEHSLKWLGGTRDDAAGEAFDKTARMLGLPYPGGPAISAEAAKHFSTPNTVHCTLDLFPRPLVNSNDLDFSFSGLKTAVLNEVKGKRLTVKEKQKYAAEIQEAIVDTLVAKSIKAVEIYKPKSFILGGGVAANDRLRQKLSSVIGHQSSDIDFFAPPKSLATDNAAMTATAAFYIGKKTSWRDMKADPSLGFT